MKRTTSGGTGGVPSIDQKTVLEMMLQAYQKGRLEETVEARHIIEHLVSRLKPFFGVEAQGVREEGGTS